MQIEIVLFDGFDELDALAPFEVLQNAASAGADFSVRLVSWAGKSEIVAAHGLRLTVEMATANDPRPDLVIVPGGGWNSRSSQGARAEADRGVIPSRLAELHQAGTIVAAVCTGAMLLASAKLLRGRAATTHHGAIDDLRAAGAEVVSARVVDDGTIITAGGVTSGLDLALWLVERYAGAQTAQAVEREMEYERRGVVWQRNSRVM
jgi:transcriptional regulator GlxA family with amidase domain